MLPNVGRMKPQNNTVFGYSSSYQFVGNPVFSAIALNPHSVVDNINVEQATVNAADRFFK